MKEPLLSKFLLFPLFLLINCSVSTNQGPIKKFVHPGIDQTLEDLEYMKQQVSGGNEPWLSAFERLKEATDLEFKITPYTHVIRGSYGKPNIGGNDLSRGANMAYDCALLWYISGEKAYAQKSIEIINAWSSRLWDFDYNDAKLLAGWTGYLFCNAAEILRYTDSGWKQEDIEAFNDMLMTVYFPLLRFYFPQANGNWDGAIIHSILAIAVFTDNRDMFDNAIDHFLYAPVNGSIFKYIHPSGQCQESTRDQAHVQLGLGEFAGAARIAHTQGIDLFSLAGNRIALGFEYTAKFLVDDKPFSYGVISERAKSLRDDWEYVYRHYASKGVEMPYTKIAADSVRQKASRSILTAFRAPSDSKYSDAPEPSPIAYPSGAMVNPATIIPSDAIIVSPGQSLQDALNAAAGTDRWVVAAAGLHTLPETLKIPNNVVLAGEGISTVLFPDQGVRNALENMDSLANNITIRDLVIEGSTRPEPPSDPNSARSYRSSANRGGIIFHALREGEINNINFVNVTVQNCTYNGVLLSGASNVKIESCNFDENGSSVVPGPRLQHNLLLSHCSNVEVTNSRMDTSPHGSGIAIVGCNHVKIDACEIARNSWHGILITESSDIKVSGCLIEATDKSGIMVEYLYEGSEDIDIANNLIQYNNGFGIESYAAKNLVIDGNDLVGNKLGEQKASVEKYIVMEKLD